MTRFKILLCLQVVILSGCARQTFDKPATNSFYLNPAKDLKRLGRVVMVEPANYCTAHHITPDVTDALFQEIQKKQIFSLTKIRQNDPSWRSLQLDTDSNFRLEELSQIRKTVQCDAILVGTIVAFEPYPHMAISLRLRLIDLSDGRLLWAIEQVWDTTDKAVQDRIKGFYSPKRLLVGNKSLSGQLGSVSSLMFFKFVAYEVAATMQPRS